MKKHDIIQENEELKRQLEGLQYMHEVYKELIHMNEERSTIPEVKEIAAEQSEKYEIEDNQRTSKQLSDFYIKMSSQFANVEQDLLEQFSMIKEVLNQLTDQRDMYENKIHSLTDTCEKLEGIQSTLVDQLESIELKKKDYEKRLVEMEKESESLQADNENLRGKIDQLLSIIANQQENVLQLQDNKKVVADNSDIKVKNEEQGGINEQIKILLEKINNMEDKISKLKQEDLQALSNEKDEQELFESTHTQTNKPQTIPDVSVPVQEQSPIIEVKNSSNMIKEKKGGQSDSTTTNSFIRLSEILQNSPENIVFTQKDQLQSSNSQHKQNVTKSNVPKYKIPSVKSANYVDPLSRLREKSTETKQSLNQQKKNHKNEVTLNPKQKMMISKQQHDNDIGEIIENVAEEESVSIDQSSNMTISEEEQILANKHVPEELSENGVKQHTVPEKLGAEDLIHQQFNEQNVSEAAIEDSNDTINPQDKDDCQLNNVTECDEQIMNNEHHLEHNNNELVDNEHLKDDVISIEEKQDDSHENVERDSQHTNVFHREQKATSDHFQEDEANNFSVINEKEKIQQTLIESQEHLINEQSTDKHGENVELVGQKSQDNLDEQPLESVDNVEHTTHMNTSTVSSQHAQESDDSTKQFEKTESKTTNRTIDISKEKFEEHVDEIEQVGTIIMNHTPYELNNKEAVERSEGQSSNYDNSKERRNNSFLEKQNKKSWFISFLKKIKIYNK
ncbi:hypothetical protein [Cytobacillus sp. IB215665]|uniref:hypothetical protein n=1 Tax=Cytobacillus sp. IB215665 TaxID=3097357 RepID=UPI002A0AF145|nr:hypothetical protein [Cytobacillus sp. IB215665]MDX8364400.1 hypothetical protein [Cytobacillus sp. IB215665]